MGAKLEGDPGAAVLVDWLFLVVEPQPLPATTSSVEVTARAADLNRIVSSRSVI